MLSSFWIRLGRRANFWLRLIIFSSSLHLFFLFFLFFVYSGQKSTFHVNINRSVLRSGAPIVFMPLMRTVSNSPKLGANSKSKVFKVTKQINKAKNKSSISKTNVVKKKVVKPKINTTSIVKKKVVKKNSILKKAKPIKTTKLAKATKAKKIVEKKVKKKVQQVVKQEIAKKKVVKSQDSSVNVSNQKPIYIGQQELESIKFQAEIEAEVLKNWRPPPGLSKNLVCIITVLVGWSGNIEKEIVSKSSGVLVYDISARVAISKLNLPKSARGREIPITFNQ